MKLFKRHFFATFYHCSTFLPQFPNNCKENSPKSTPQFHLFVGIFYTLGHSWQLVRCLKQFFIFSARFFAHFFVFSSSSSWKSTPTWINFKIRFTQISLRFFFWLSRKSSTKVYKFNKCNNIFDICFEKRFLAAVFLPHVHVPTQITPQKFWLRFHSSKTKLM